MVDPIDLRRLQMLRLVHEHGTVTAAAALVHLTPSAVSHQLRQLSRELGVPLLEQAGRRVRLTPAGEKLVGHADAMQARWEQARADLDDDASGTLRLCGFPTAVAGLLAPAAARLAAEFPQLGVRVSETESEEGFGLLLAGEVDIAVVVPSMETPPLSSAKFHQEPLLEEPLDLLVPKGHRLAGRAGVALTDTARERWILAAQGSCDFYELVQAACTSAGFAPEVVHRAKDAVAVSALVAGGLGVALAPRLAALQSPDGGAVRVAVRGHPRPSRRVMACLRRGSEDQPVVKRGLDALRAVAADAV
jgi:DNA-binding transcriptional LysR family regulator